MIQVQAPASKSVSHRVLIGAALAGGESVVTGLLESRDLECTRASLEAAGARMEREADGSLRVWGVGGKPRGASAEEMPVSCDVHESGTTCRLLTAVLAAGEGRFRIHGAPRMHQRPIGALTDVLSAMGAGIHFEEKPGYPPLLLEARGLRESSVSIGLSESSQYLSGLLLAAPMAAGPVTIGIGGVHVVSWPYVGLTLQTMHDFGILFDVSEYEASSASPWKLADWRELRAIRPGMVRFRVRPSAYRVGKYQVEGDWSGASYLLAAGALGESPVRVRGLRLDSLQGDRAIREIMEAMGAQIAQGEDLGAQWLEVSPSSLRGVDVDMSSCPDLVPTVTLLAAAASGDTRIRGVAHLRIKECDRIAAPVTELRKAGIDAEERDDGLLIHGKGKPRLAGQRLDLSVWGDHRMAMSLSLLECFGAEVHLDDPAVVSKSFPAFWDAWATLRPGFKAD